MMFANILFLLLTSSLSWGYSVINSEPPNPSEKALAARYVIHQTDWVAISTISTLKYAKSHPFVNIKSMSDGPVSQGTGVPYLLMTNLDFTGKDLLVDKRCSIMASLAESNYCVEKDYDPQDPRCGRVILIGTFAAVEIGTNEYDFAKDALFSRHPFMKTWPNVHTFYVGKLKIEHVLILNDFGGSVDLSLEDYFNANGTGRFVNSR